MANMPDNMPDAAASAVPTAASQAEAVLRAQAIAAQGGSGSSPKEPAAGELLNVTDLAKWAAQVEAEFERGKQTTNSLDTRLAALSDSVASAQVAVTACTAQVAHCEAVIHQFIDNQSGRSAASRDDGDAQDRQRQKAQLNKDTSTWEKVSTS